MDTLRTGELVLLVLLVLLGPVSCRDNFFTEPVICYFLDGFLFIYCITATALFFREKFSFIPAEEGTAGEKEGIYQELERPGNDVYQVLDQKKTKKKGGKKNRAKKAADQQRSPDQPEPGIPLQTLAPH